jgi:hypothetical protein
VDRVSAEEFVAVAVELVRPIVMAGVVTVPQIDEPAATSVQQN